MHITKVVTEHNHDLNLDAAEFNRAKTKMADEDFASVDLMRHLDFNAEHYITLLKTRKGRSNKTYLTRKVSNAIQKVKRQREGQREADHLPGASGPREASISTSTEIRAASCSVRKPHSGAAET